MITQDEFFRKVDNFQNKHGDTISRFLSSVPEIDNTFRYLKIGNTHSLLMNELLENLDSQAVIKVHSFKETQTPLLFIYSNEGEIFETNNVLVEDKLVERFAREVGITRMLLVDTLSRDFRYDESCIGAYIEMDIISEKKVGIDKISICFPIDILSVSLK